ncbi:N-acetyltransferase [Coprobacter tertius]|uniref:N-acetyltransferase n=1 Tax=Coprobacter tertius TaxID=2944915 RepID=A0ABT1MK97_9BACT|nr:N-acetyltransferase [Coprobacter tertius]MCP9612429.1 N-acetyltransferase [Coprobacter tertius]
MGITIREISGKRELKKFARFNIDLYKNNPYAVPQLIYDEVNTLNADTNPAFEYCESVYYMAFDGEIPVGRIAGIINNRVNEKTGRKTARFGFVDFIDDPDVSKALFNAVETWAREKGMEEVNGPLGFTDMDPEGLLVEGFDQIGTMVAIYNYPYYIEHITKLGYEKDVDWVEFKIFVPESIPEKHQRIANIVKTKYKLDIVKYTSSKKLVKDYGQKIFELINDAYANLYGYSPLNQRQIDYYIKMYLPMVRLENVTLIINEEKDLIGVGIAIPSMTRAMQKAKGKLFPFGFIHILKALRGKNDIVDLLLVAIRPDYQNTGANALLFSDLIPVFIKNGYKYAESNPELEENGKVQSQWQYFENKQHKRRRAYLKKI